MKAHDTLLSRKIYAALAVFVLLTLGLMAGAFQHQVLKREQYLAWAIPQELKPVRLTPLRGRILDRWGNPLAVSLEVGSVFAHPGLVKNPHETARLVGRILGIRPADLEKELRKEVSFTWLARQIPLERAQAVQKLGLDGVGMEKEGKRYYPNRELAGQIIGFAGMDSQGLEGLEYGFDSYLSGPEITLMLQHDAYGRVLWQEVALESAKKAACELHLTLDLKIQYFAEETLGRAVDEAGAQSGAAVVMDPNSGEVLAIACMPRFNPNSFPDYTSLTWRNRPIADAYEPGSTMKAFLLSAALEEGIVDEETLFDCEMGHFAYGGRIIHDKHPYGVMTVREVISHSSNIGTAKIADRLGARNLWIYLDAFGFGQATGVDLPGESPGSLTAWKQWAKIGVANHAFGQGFSITPVQLANAFSTLANGGFRVEPYLVSSILDERGRSLLERRPRALRRVISKKTADRVLSVLETVVQAGTGRMAQIPGYRVAGKTGTAQVYDPALGTYSDTRSVVSFVGIAPVERPALVIAVVINEPKGVASGGRMAAPVFREIAIHSLRCRGVPDGEPALPESAPPVRLCAAPRHGGLGRVPVAASAPTAASAAALQVPASAATTESATDLRVPNLTRLPLRAALRALAAFPVEIAVEGTGTVLEQEPDAGTPVQAGQTVRLKATPSGWIEAEEPAEEASQEPENDEARGTSQGA